MWLLLLLFLFLLLDFFIKDHLSFRCSNMCNTRTRLLIFVVLLHFMRYFTKYFFFFCFYFRNFESVSFLLFIISLVSLMVSHSRLISFRTIPTLQSVHLEQRLRRLYKLLVLIYVSRRRSPSRINLFIAFFVVFVLGDSEEWWRGESIPSRKLCKYLVVWLSVGMERRKKRTNIHIEEEMSARMMIFCLYSYWRITNKKLQLFSYIQLKKCWVWKFSKPERRCIWYWKHSSCNRRELLILMPLYIRNSMRNVLRLIICLQL